MNKLLSIPALLVFVVITACNSGNEEKRTEGGDGQSAPAKPNRLDSLSAVLKEDPNNAMAFLTRAEEYMKRGYMQSAANDIYNAFQIDSGLARARELKGELHFIQNRSREAKGEWEECIRLDPENVNCRLKLAELYIAVQDYQKALVLVNEAIQIDNQNAPAYFMKGLVVRDYYQDTTLALQYFQKAVDLKQDFTEALDMMGVMLARRKDTLAKYYYERVLELEPNRADIYYKLGFYYMQQDEINRALENYTKAVQLNPRDAESYFNMGYIHVELRNFAQARDYFTKAIQVKEKNYKAYYGRGYCFEMLGDVLNARKDYRSALEANPIYTPAQQALARVNNIISREP